MKGRPKQNKGRKPLIVRLEVEVANKLYALDSKFKWDRIEDIFHTVILNEIDLTPPMRGTERVQTTMYLNPPTINILGLVFKGKRNTFINNTLKVML